MSRLRSAAPILAAVALYLLVAVWQTWAAFSSPVPVILGGGDQPDWTGTLWTWWWTWEALAQGVSPALAESNLFPVGLSPVAQYNLVDAVLLGWLVEVVGVTRGYNLAGLLLLAGAGLSGHAMCRGLGIAPWPATIAGLLLQCSTTLLIEVTTGRLSQALVVFGVLGFAGCLRLTSDSARLRDVVSTGVLVGLAALTYWYSALFVALGALPALFLRPRRSPRMWMAAGVSGLVCLPAVLALVAYGEALPGMSRPVESWMADASWTRGRYGLGMAMAHSHQPLWPLATGPGDPFDKRISPVLMGLAALGAWRGQRTWRGPLLGAVLVGWLMTLGPWLRSWDGSPVAIPLPWLFLDAFLPFFDRMWWPERFELTMLLGLVPLAGLGAAVLAKKRFYMAALVGLVLVEQAAWQPFHPLPVSPPRPYDAALYAALDGPTVTTPVLAPFADVRHALFMQTLHQQPITGGLGEHLPGHVSPEWTRYVESNALLDALADGARGPLPARVIEPAAVDALVESGLRWVVVDSSICPPGDGPAWTRRDRSLLEAVFGAPDVTTRGGAAWRIEPIQDSVRTPVLEEPPRLPDPRSFLLKR